MKRLALHWKIIIGLALGLVWALLSSFWGWSGFTQNWIAPFGTIFINLLKLIAVPLVLFSIISGVSSLGNAGQLGKLAVKTLSFYIATTVLAILIGLALVNLIKPGKTLSDNTRIANRIDYELWMESLPEKNYKDTIRLLQIPEYQTVAAERKSMEPAAGNGGTELISRKLNVAAQEKQSGPLDFLVQMIPSNIFSSLNDNNLILQVIVFAVFFGITLLTIPAEKSGPVVSFVNSMNEVFLKMVDVIMQGAPFFVFALLAGTLSNIAGNEPEKVIQIFKGLGWYSLTVILGLFTMGWVIYPLIIKFFSRGMPVKGFLKGMGPAQLMAFSTSSSAATLPVTMDCVRENLNVSQRISSFVLPIGATVNMDGTALYQAVAVVFLAQLHMVDLSAFQQMMIVLTTVLASIGSAAVPSAGLIMLIIVLQSVGLNPLWIAIILPVDRILDMCRTVINITGDAAVATVIASSEGELNYKPKEKLDNFDL